MIGYLSPKNKIWGLDYSGIGGDWGGISFMVLWTASDRKTKMREINRCCL
jgi:hypothetical protein